MITFSDSSAIRSAAFVLESVATLAELVRDFDFTAPAGSSDQVPVGSGVTLFPLEPVLSQVAVRP